MLTSFVNHCCYFTPRTDFKLEGFESDRLFESEKFLWECYHKFERLENRWPLARTEWQQEFLKEAVRLGHKSVHLDLHSRVLNYVGPVFFGVRAHPRVYGFVNQFKSPPYGMEGSQGEEYLKSLRDEASKKHLLLFLKMHLVYKPNEVTKQKEVFLKYRDSLESFTEGDFKELPISEDRFMDAIRKNYPNASSRGIFPWIEWNDLLFVESGLNRQRVQGYLNKTVRNLP